TNSQVLSAASMLESYIYDTSSVQDSLLQPAQESAMDRVARLMASVNATARVLSTSSTPAPNTMAGASRL
ncbi:hypothetical protein B0T18DRAFT_323977, partial [Schizothecium vesticola]